MRLLKMNLLFLLAVLIVFIPVTASAAAATIQLTGEIAYVPIGEGFYGIIGDDGQKYQPTNLPRELRKAGLPVKFSAISRKDSFTSIMWGNIIEIQTITRISPAISSTERAAIRLLLQRIDAFNTKDLHKLRQIDTVAGDLSEQQFLEWIGNFHSFTLRYVEITHQDSSSITGACIYTRESEAPELADSPTMAYLQFTLDRSKTGWKLTKSLSDSVPYSLEVIKKKALEKYKTDDLSTLWL
ncbi:MAG TPA: hypothetical protein DCP36_08100 [Sporomusaceae bacterium]|uniref:hypothetical protein n=1 Tax=Anaerospora sp. TaxID=1960278 RepID=UPI000EF04E1E|nr:hypothetical protein [Anaerospora sp.]HAK73560.1 hypothetical protein [Sporomusaceae bacterium]